MRKPIGPEKLNRLAREIADKIRRIKFLETLAFSYASKPGHNTVRLQNMQNQMFSKLNNLKKYGNFKAQLNRKNDTVNLNAIRNEIRLFRSIIPREMTALARFYSSNVTNLPPSHRSRPSQENANRYINALAHKYKVPRALLNKSNYVLEYKKVFNNNPEVRAYRLLKKLRKKAIENKRLAVATALRQLPASVSQMIVSRKNLRLPSSPVSIGRLFN